MSLYIEQMKENGINWQRNPVPNRRWIKRQRNKKLRRIAKDINQENPQTNFYKGWTD